MADLAGRHALVTGAGKGIGAVIAAALGADGARITLVGRHRETLDAAAANLPASAKAQTIVCDISDSAAVAEAMQRARDGLGPIEVLINNAGQAQSAPLSRTDDALWAQMLGVNLSGTFFCTRAVLPEMIAARWGRVVNIASTAAQRGYPYVSAYCAAKHGVLGLTRALALEVANKGITVNAVCPGYTDTDIVADAVANIVSTTGRSVEAARAELVKGNPQGQLIAPEQVANAVLWLCRAGSDAITGQAISVSGGEVM